MSRISLRITEESSRPQPCGDCTACCHVLGIGELEKPNWKDCQYQNSGCKGCSIYNTKPQECSDYWCFFSGGMFGKDISYRPDKVGLIVDFRGKDGLQFLQVWETRPNAHKEKRARLMIDSLGERFPIVLRKYGRPLSKIQIFGSKSQIQEVTQFLLADMRESARQEEILKNIGEQLDKAEQSAKV